MSESTKKNSGETPAQQKLAEFEAAQLTRRAALAKFGLRSVAAVLGVLTIDDLARKVGQQMERQAGNNQIASAVAKEFQAAGIAFADDTSIYGTPCKDGKNCNKCPGGADGFEACMCKADAGYNDCIGTPPAGCDAKGGSFWPWCYSYNQGLLTCAATRSGDQINCQA